MQGRRHEQFDLRGSFAMTYRIEQDTMGEVRVPETAYYGAQTQRAVENFTVSGLTFPPPFIHALALIKRYAALVNGELGLLAPPLCEAIAAASREVCEGKLDDQFVVDIFQTGSGTSTNMNANEVIAGRANEILTGRRGGKAPVHPNDHVNLGQSSNDVIPSAIHIAALVQVNSHLIPAMERLRAALQEKALAFSEIRKIGRTHLQDAVPVTLGQEFSGYARQVELGIERLNGVRPRLSELALGGTAVGTGINTHPEFAAGVISGIAAETGVSFKEAVNHFEAQAAQDAVVETSGILKTVAVSFTKIANDLRWLASGPRCGIGEIALPSLQPGSSIMPGKVNPVIPEVVLQVCAQVIGHDSAVTLGGQSGTFELNVMFPLLAYDLLQSIRWLGETASVFEEKCIRGIQAHKDKCASYLEQSLALVTPLVPHIGYDRAAALAKKAFETHRTIREVALDEQVLTEAEIQSILDKLVSG
jgi:fumarate hydratase, class II